MLWVTSILNWIAGHGVSVSYLAIQPIAGHFADKLDVAKTIRIGLALSALSVIAIPFASGVLLAVVAAIAGIGVGTVWTNTDTLMSNLAKEGKLGETMGVAGSFKELGDMVGPLLIGILAQAFGLTIGFVACGILGLGALLLIARPTVVKSR